MASICKTLFLYLALGVILGELRLERELSQQSVCMPCKHEDISSIPSTPIKSQAWWHMLVTPERCPGSLATQPVLLRKLQAGERPCLRKQSGWLLRSHTTRLISGLHTQTQSLKKYPDKEIHRKRRTHAEQNQAIPNGSQMQAKLDFSAS